MKKIIDFVKKNRVAQFVLVLIVGIVIGAIFYPTKRIEERVKQEYQEKIDKVVEEKEQIRKELTEDIVKKVEEHSEYKIEMSKEINKLEVQVKELNAKKKETFYKIVKPDGTIEIRQYKESELSETTQIVTKIREEFDTKIKSIAYKWQDIHKKRVEILKKDFDKREQEYKTRIEKLEKEKITIINPKSFGLGIGYLSNKNYYGNVSYDIFGPIFLDLHTESNFNSSFAVGGGLGVRF